MSPDSKPPWLPPPAPKMIRRRENGKQADAPCFQESSPCFLSVICFWRNYLKSLIPLSDLPVRAQSPPCFSWKISLFLEEKQGSAARRILRRLEFHYTPKHASWLNMVEIEIGVLRGQCLDRRIDDPKRLISEIAAWERQRNAAGARIKWMFTTDKARAKMGRAYPVTSKDS
jgi:hypothetical protein